MPEIDVELWLKPEDIEPEAELNFIDAGEKSSIPGKEGEADTPTFEIGVILSNGSKRKWTMNKTSQRAVAQAYGTNTDDWKDKKVIAYISVQNVRGTEKKVIYARIPAGL